MKKNIQKQTLDQLREQANQNIIEAWSAEIYNALVDLETNAYAPTSILMSQKTFDSIPEGNLYMDYQKKSGYFIGGIKLTIVGLPKYVAIIVAEDEEGKAAMRVIGA